MENHIDNIRKEVLCLTDGSRLAKKRSLEKIKKELLILDHNTLNSAFDDIRKPILKMISDPVDRCREISISIVSNLYSCLQEPHLFLPDVMAVITQRLGLNSKDAVEPTEEIRRDLVMLLLLIRDRSHQHLGPYIEDLIGVLAITLVDSYPDVRRASCQLTQEIATSLPDKFYLQGETLIKPLMISLSHQHNKVRIAVLQAVGTTILHTSGACVDDVLSHIAQRTFDHSAAVRMMVTQVVGDWLCHLRDRYSYFHKLLPLLMTGLSDEMPEIRERSKQLFDEAGEIFENENEKDFKEKKEFYITKHFETMIEHERPSVGCRALVQRNFSKILPALLGDINDWNAQTRLKAMSLLAKMLIYAEDFATMHASALIQGLCKSCQDNDAEVVKMVETAACNLGLYVEPSVWCKLALENLRLVSTSSKRACGANCHVIACLLKSTNPHLLQDQLSNVVEALSAPEICATVDVQCQHQLVFVADALLNKKYIDLHNCGYELFLLLVTINSLSVQQEINEKSTLLLQILAERLELTSSACLIEKFGTQAVTSLTNNVICWTADCHEVKALATILELSGTSLSALLNLCLDPLLNAVNPNTEPELRISIFSMLSKVFINQNTPTVNDIKALSPQLIKQFILPNCIWTAGRKAAAVRSSAISLLWTIIKTESVKWDEFKDLLPEIHKQLISCLEDSDQTTRLVTCKVLLKMLQVFGKEFHVEMLHACYPELLKRLDDHNNEIRIIACKSLTAYFACLPTDYDLQLFHLLLQEIYRCLLVHLDDPNYAVQEEVLLALKAGAVVDGSFLKSLVVEVQHKHRNEMYCNKLINHIDAIHKTA